MIILGLIIGVITLMFGLWQMDLIVSDCVWKQDWISPDGGYYNQSFEFGRIGKYKLSCTIGQAYDYCQALIVIGLIVSVMSMVI